MAQISSPGIGSGLDIGGLVTQLVQAERAPQENRLNSQEVRAQARLSAYGSLKGALSSFQSALEKLKDSALYEGRSATLSSEALFSVSVDSDADIGNYSIQAEQLASRHKIASTAYASDDATVGTGTLTFTVNGSSFAVDVESGSDTLSAIRDAINNAEDNVGVSASIIRDQDGSHLVLTSDKTGADYEIKVDVTTDGGDTGTLSDLAFDPAAGSNPMTEKQAAQDAQLIIDGFTATSSDNVFDDVLDGVSITLKDSDPGQSHSLGVALETASLEKAVKDFVNAYNSLRTKINTLTAYDPETGKAGLLQGDATTRQLSSQLRNELASTITDADDTMDTLAEIGITTDFTNGKLELDSDKLNELIENNFSGFSALFSGDSGLAARLDDLSKAYTRFEGILDTRTDGLKSQIERISDQREALNRRMASVESRYTAQFNALDTLLGELNQTSSFLTTQLANLPFANRDK